MTRDSIATGHGRPVRRLVGGVVVALCMLLAVPAVQASAGTVGSAAQPVHYGYLLRYGNYGIGPGLFDNPAGVAVDPSSGDVYVTDAGNNRIQRFDSHGNFLGEFGETGIGQLDDPAGIAVDPATDNVYVFDYGNARVVEFDASGSYLGQFGGPGNGPGEFGSPNGNVEAGGLAIDPTTGTLDVVDSSNNRVERFTLAGGYLGEFGDAGTGPGTLSCPNAIAIDAKTSDVYVANAPCGNLGVHRFTAGGSFLGTFAASGPVAFADALAVDPVSGDVFLGDYYGNHVYVFDTGGNLLDEFGHSDLDGASLVSPVALALDPTTDDVYAASASQYVAKFDQTPLRATATILSCPNLEIALGKTITCLATVTDTDDTGSPVTPTGTVDVSSGGAGPVSGAPCTLAGTGASASCAVSFLSTSLGNIQLVATYSGDAAHAVSDNGSFNGTVLFATYPTQTRVNCDPGVILSGATTTCAVRVIAVSGGAPSGEVRLTNLDGPHTKGSACTLTIVSDDAAKCQATYSSTALGVRQIIAAYGGDLIDHASAEQTAVRVRPRSTGSALDEPDPGSPR